MASDHEEWRPVEGHRDGGWTHRWVRYHVDTCEHAERTSKWDERAVRFDDGTVCHPNIAAGWHRWLLAHLASRQGHGWDYLDLCGCITGARETAAA